MLLLGGGLGMGVVVPSLPSCGKCEVGLDLVVESLSSGVAD